MLKFPPSVFIPGLFEQRLGTLKDAGISFSVSAYHPVGYRDLSRVPHDYEGRAGYGIGGGFPTPGPDPEEMDGFYTSIVADPFDSAPRQAFADWMEEKEPENVGTFEGWPQVFRDYAGGYRPALASFSQFHKWEGPGYIARGPYGTWDTWAGGSGQFPQACRAGLFIDMPITTVVTPDIWPFRQSQRVEYVLFRSAAAQTRWIQAGLNQGPLSLSECQQSLLNDLIAHFLPSAMIYPYPGTIGAYRAFNRMSAILAVSVAHVRLGRYAAGLPDIGFPDKYIPYGSGAEDQWDVTKDPYSQRDILYQSSLQTLWQCFRQAWELEDDPDTYNSRVTLSELEKRRPLRDYGRRWYRGLLKPSQPERVLGEDDRIECVECGEPVNVGNSDLCGNCFSGQSG